MALSPCPCIKNSLPFIGMVSAMVALATSMIIAKVAMSKGASFYIISVYSNGLAALILFPTSFLLNRSKRPHMSFPVLWRIFLAALCGCLADIGSYAGINYSSPTLGSELLNLVPGFAYILAVIFRMEGLNLKTSSGISKCLGTLVLIGGASIVTLYKGAAIMNKTPTLGSLALLSPAKQDWVLGGTLLAMASFSVAAWSIVQAMILKIYPVEAIVVAIYCLFVTIQCTVIALIAEKDSSAWKLRAEMALAAVLYSGIINITFRLYLTSLCLTRAGPLFVTLFNPLTIVITVVIGVIFFHEALYIGSVIGSIILVIGFYAVIWGKAKENMMKKDIEGNNVESASHEVPLLQDRIEEA